MNSADTLSWVTSNILTFAILLMSQEVITLLGHLVSWIGILALAVYNGVKAYSTWRKMQNNEKNNYKNDNNDGA